tara:strand:+ start:36041 stop:37876 length:1836 start_codon:yes stop_codon:yes gene_type:complete
MADKISYVERDFLGLRTELVNLTKEYYPDLIQNYNDASLYSVFLDMNAAIGDNLHYHIDRTMQETVLDYAQQKQSIYNIARTYGLKLPGKRPSVSLVDFTVNVPVSGDKEDSRYLGILRRGAQVSGSGHIFETIYDIDFSSQYDLKGNPNRTKIPVVDGSGTILSYNITKREVVVNGITKVFKKVIRPSDVKPFTRLYLPDADVLGIVDVLEKQGTSFSTIPSDSEFRTSKNKWYEVKSLSQDRIFTQDPTSPSDQPGVVRGKYKTVDKRFVSEFTPEGFSFITFGGGNTSAQDQFDTFVDLDGNYDLLDFTNNLSLGKSVKPNTTLYIKYRVGGGITSNVGVNALNSLGEFEFAVTGPSSTVNTKVINSLRANNVAAAIGGADKPSLEEIRNMVAFNFAAQERAVTLNDYRILIKTMPAKYGAPSKVNVFEEDNKIRINLLSYDSDGSLTSKVSNVLRQNISEYLAEYRMINDYIETEAAEIIDLGFEIDVILDKNVNQTEIITKILSEVSSYLEVDGRDLGDHLYVGELKQIVNSQSGVINLVDLRVIDKVGEGYSDTKCSQPYVDEETKQIKLGDETVYMRSNQIYQVRFPSKDIVIRVKTISAPLIS